MRLGKTRSPKPFSYTYIPPAGSHLLTKAYDPFVSTIGFGRRFREHLLALARLSGKETIVDVGCATGLFLGILKAKFPAIRAIGIDPDKQSIKIAQRRLKRKGLTVELIEAFAENLPLPDISVDVCFTSFTLHHLPDAAKVIALREMARVLKKGGRLVAADFGHTDRRLTKALLFFEKREYINSLWSGKLVHFIQQAGLMVVDSSQGGLLDTEIVVANKP